MNDEPQKKFTERLSWFMVVTASCGALLVLIDPQIKFTFGSDTFSFGGAGFSADLKGAVVSLILIGGWSAVKEYWLGSSSGSAERAKTIDKLIVATTPAPAPATTPAPAPAPDPAARAF